MEDRKIRVAITHGDTNGIGYEMIFKTFAEQEMLELCTPIIYGSPKVAAYHRNVLGIQANFSIISKADEAHDGRMNLLTVFEDDVKVDLGKPSDESGTAAVKALERAIEDQKNGLVDAIVAAPVNESTFKKNGKVFIRSGAGIVYDSVPEKEHEECLNKARAVLNSLEKAGKEIDG